MRPSALAALALLGGCAGPTVYHSYYASLYEPGQVRLAAADNPALAVIRNNPFPADRGNAGVVDAMQGVNFGPKITFSQTPRPDDRFGYKVVLDFGESRYGATAICEAGSTAPVQTPSTGPIEVHAAFCLDKILLSETAASAAAAASPDDPRFRRMIADVLVALTPSYDPKRVGDRCRVFGC